jgi:biofilm PGA synthesis protein PgaA
VQQARAGQLDEALQKLERLHELAPTDTATRLDLAVVCHWAGQDDRTLALLDPLPPESLPVYALEAHAKAARNRQRWDQSLALYRRIAELTAASAELTPASAELTPASAELTPASAELTAGGQALIAQALVLADAERFEEALAAVRELSGRVTSAADVNAACGYVNARARRHTAALACYTQALRVAPAHAEARRGYILAAAALGATGPALDQAQDHPGLLSEAELARLELDAAAQALRWALLPASTAQAERRNRARAALATHDRLALDPAIAHANAYGRVLQFDRVVALVADYRMTEAVDAIEALQAEGLALEDFPVYALAAAGEAYAYLRRPRRAAAVYEAALLQTPDDFGLRIGLFYARSDLDDHAGARAVARDLLAAEPPWIKPAPGRFLANIRYAEAREVEALELAFRDDYDAALAKFDALLSLAPANPNLRLTRAELLRWRGWQEAARRDLERVRRQAPENTRVDVIAGHIDLDGRRFAEAEAAVERARARDPDGRAALDLARRWRNHHRPELTISAAAGRSDGDALSSRDWQVDGYYFSAPLNYRYRLFAHDLYRYGRFDEGDGRDHRLGAGVDYRAPRWSGRVEVNRGLEQNRSAGATAGLSWHAGDHLDLGVRAHLNAANLPLRATRGGVEADGLELSASYRWDETRTLSAAAGWLDFDDGNRRRWSQLSYRGRLLNQPRQKVLAEVRGYASDNSASDRPYFNPSGDRQVTAGLIHEWRVFRDHQQGLVQRLGVEAGSYWQEDAGAGAVWTLSLEHDWALDDRTRIRYGISGGGRRYDGEQEHVLSGQVTLERQL